MMNNKLLTQKSVLDILSPYGIEHIDSFRLLSGGSANSNYLVKTTSGNYVITISEQKSLDDANGLANLLEYLVVNNFPSSKIVNLQLRQLLHCGIQNQ